MKPLRERTMADQLAVEDRLRIQHAKLAGQRDVLAALREARDAQRESLPWFEGVDDLLAALGYQMFLTCKYIAELSELPDPPEWTGDSDGSPF